MNPDFTQACRWLLAHGWTKNDPGSFLSPDGKTTVNWDWDAPGTEASYVPPPGSVFTVEVSRETNGRWSDDLIFKPVSVTQAVDYLVAARILPMSFYGEPCTASEPGS